MFLFTEINYRFSRTPGRTIIVILAAVMLVASMGAFLGNLQASQAALDDLAESIPVTARVVERSGSKTSQLSVDTEHFDALTSLNVHGVLCTSGAVGAWSREAQAQDPFAGGDTVITAAYSQMGARYTPIGEHTLTVAAIYPYSEVNDERSPDVSAPVSWLRGAAESAGSTFYYSSLSAVLDDPLHLTQFKEALPGLGFMQVDSASSFVHFCAALLTQLLGGCLAMAPLVLSMGLSFGESLQILAAYMLCACAGTALALFQLFRFDTLTLLTKND